MHPELPPVSALDVPQLKTAQYVAVVDHAPPLSEAMWVELERGAYQCGPALADLDRTDRPEDPKCPNAIVNALKGARSHGLVVIDANGTHTLNDHDLASFLGGIDSPQKALLAALLHGCELGWTDDDGHAGGGSATAGLVDSVAGGYEVFGGRSESEPYASCGERNEERQMKQTTRTYQVGWLVDHAGAITIREERLLSEKTEMVTPDCNVR
jgi:hypothetical protein